MRKRARDQFPACVKLPLIDERSLVVTLIKPLGPAEAKAASESARIGANQLKSAPINSSALVLGSLAGHKRHSSQLIGRARLFRRLFRRIEPRIEPLIRPRIVLGALRAPRRRLAASGRAYRRSAAPKSNLLACQPIRSRFEPIRADSKPARLAS